MSSSTPLSPSTTSMSPPSNSIAKMSRQQGFTLMELILSMALTALLLATLSAGMYSVINDWQRETSGLDTQLDKSLALLQIEKSLFAAFPHSYVDRERLTRFVYFNGSADEMSWVSTTSPQRQTGLTAWHIESNRNDGLQLKLSPAFSDNPEQRLDEALPISILENYQAQFRYLLQRNTEEKEWLDEWIGEDMQSLPIAVQIIFTPVNNDSLDEVFEIIAPIKNHRHESIQPTLPEV